jgi:pimeloyl-ACP methyl ester carboxylesterase
MLRPIASLPGWLLLSGLAILPVGAGAADAPLAWKSCRLEHASRLISIEAQCTTLRVPEDEARPAGRQIELFVARVPAVSGRKAPDPLLLIAGGPGMGASEMYPGVAAAFARLRRERDLIVVDQRGTGRSGALRCEEDAELELSGDRDSFRAATQRCFEALRASADLRQYTTSIAVRDLERVRRALGVERWNVYGVSYGSRVALHYLRRHPDRIRSAILDGVVPPGLALGPGIALDAQAAFERILERCRREAACATRFGDPRVHYDALLARLRTRPVELLLPDPTRGEPRPLRFGADQLGAVLRLQSYASTTASLLPLALHEAATRSNFVPLAGLFAMTVQNLTATIAAGMHHSVVCTEDLPFVEAGAIDRARLAGTFLGTTQLDALQDVCTFWPRGVLDADFRAPLRSDVPALLLSGADDPVTPPSNAELAMQGLRRARHLTLPGQGHGQIGVTCMDRVVAAFVRDLDPDDLDARCLAAVRPAPFFTTLSGAAP